MPNDKIPSVYVPIVDGRGYVNREWYRFFLDILKISRVDFNLSELENDVSELGSNVSGLTNDVNNLEQNVTDLENQIDQIIIPGIDSLQVGPPPVQIDHLIQSETPDLDSLQVGPPPVQIDLLTALDKSGLSNVTPVTFLNGWSNYGNGLTEAGYYKDRDGVVHLRGVVEGGTIGQPMFRLPAGFRPVNGEIFSVICLESSDISNGYVAVEANGDVTLVSLNPIEFASISGISFRTDV